MSKTPKKRVGKNPLVEGDPTVYLGIKIPISVKKRLETEADNYGINNISELARRLIYTSLGIKDI